MNNRVASIRLEENDESSEMSLIGYDRENFVGKYVWYEGDVSDMGSLKNVASIQVRPWSPEGHEGDVIPPTVFYEHADFEGDHEVIEGAADFVKLDNRLSSIKCMGECGILAFEQRDFEGEARLFNGSQRFLSGFNDQVSSVLVLRQRLCATLFEHANFEGASVEICNDVDDFKSLKINDRMSSMKLSCQSCSVILYEHKSFEGRFKSYVGDVDFFEGPLNDLFSSMQLRPWELPNYEGNTYAVAVLYEHRNYEGKSIRVESQTDYIGDAMNDKASSIKCEEQECSFLTFEEAKFQGKSRLYDQSQMSLQMNDQLSSLMVMKGKICVIIYEHANFQGSFGEYCRDVSDLREESFNDKLSSFKVTCDFCSVIFYEDTNMRGRYKAYMGEVAEIEGSLNDLFSSFEIRPWKLENFEGDTNPTVVLYEHRNFKGKHITVDTSSKYIGGGLNDKISSIQCEHKEHQCSYVVFEHRDMEGDSCMYQGSQEFLQSFNDKMTSLTVISGEICVTVYQHSEYKGKASKHCSDVADLRKTDMNDMISSIKLDCDFCSVIVYEDVRFQGKYKSFSGDVSLLSGGWNDVVSSIQIRPWKMENIEGTTKTIEGQGTKSCVDEGERKAYNVIQWIPLVSTLYDLGSSIYYGAAGCDSVAKERAISLGIGTAIDVATVLTGGAAGVAAYGVKTGMKAGIRAGMKAALNGAKASIRSAIKKTISRGVSGNLKAIAKNAAGQVKSLMKTAKSIPKGVYAGGKAVKKVATQSVKKTAKGLSEQGKKAFKALKTIGDDLAESVRRKVDDVSLPSVHKTPKFKLCRVKRMLGGKSMCAPLRQQRAQQRAMERSADAKKFFDNVAVDNAHTVPVKLTNADGVVSNLEAIKHTVAANDRPAREVLEDLAHFHDHMPGKRPLMVDMDFGGERFEFVVQEAGQGSGRQIFVGFPNKIDETVSHSYDGIIKQLDQGDPRANARTILEILEGGDDWAQMTATQREAAKELMVLTHVAESAVPEEKVVRIYWKLEQGIICITLRKLKQ